MEKGKKLLEDFVDGTREAITKNIMIQQNQNVLKLSFEKHLDFLKSAFCFEKTKEGRKHWLQVLEQISSHLKSKE